MCVYIYQFVFVAVINIMSWCTVLPYMGIMRKMATHTLEINIFSLKSHFWYVLTVLMSSVHMHIY